MTYTLGLDIGIASVGFAGVNMGSGEILFVASHLFDAAERRKARGQRRVIRRRAQRKRHIRKLLEENGLDTSLIGPSDKNNDISVWQLRAEALDRKLNDAELAKVLFHIAKRRGYQPNREDKKADKEAKSESKKVLGRYRSC